MPRIKKGDTVQVITGAKQDRGGDRGKQGKVLAVDFEKNRVIVEGVNMIKRHNKVGQTDKGARTGGIETKEASVHLSNVALIDPSTFDIAGSHESKTDRCWTGNTLGWAARPS